MHAISAAQRWRRTLVGALSGLAIKKGLVQVRMQCVCYCMRRTRAGPQTLLRHANDHAA
jgi:hypothetical protein